jgi:hypothetical protein
MKGFKPTIKESYNLMDRQSPAQTLAKKLLSEQQGSIQEIRVYLKNSEDLQVFSHLVEGLENLSSTGKISHEELKQGSTLLAKIIRETKDMAVEFRNRSELNPISTDDVPEGIVVIDVGAISRDISEKALNIQTALTRVLKAAGLRSLGGNNDQAIT